MPSSPMSRLPDCAAVARSEEHTSELQSQFHLVCRLLLEKKKNPGTTAGRGRKDHLHSISRGQGVVDEDRPYEPNLVLAERDRHGALSPFFFFNDTATTEIYTLSLHDALPISRLHCRRRHPARRGRFLLR